MRNRRVQYKVGAGVWYNLNIAKEVAEIIAVKFTQQLLRHFDWEGALQTIYATSGLDSLANRWLRNQAPDLAYAYVVEVDYPSYASRYIAVNQWKNEGVKL